MTDSLLNKHQRKKARRKAQKQSERQAHRDLDTVTSQAIEEALRLAPTIVADGVATVMDVPIASLSEAQYVRKRINDALQVAEWLDVVSTTLWQAGPNVGGAMSERGSRSGFELRLARREL